MTQLVGGAPEPRSRPPSDGVGTAPDSAGLTFRGSTIVDMAPVAPAAPSLPIEDSVSVAQTGRGPNEFDERALLSLFAAIAARDAEVQRMLEQTPGVTARPLQVGASRQDPGPYFLIPIGHYVYAGDTALHVAAAAHHRQLVESLVAQGAAVRARNRRGAEPVHYAADGRPGADDWESSAQREVISCLIDAGADPDALDKSGVAPLHRAVRTRSSGAVGALIDRVPIFC